MDTWALLSKELEYHGIKLIDHTKCQIISDDNQSKVQGIIRTIREINKTIKEQKKLLVELWEDVVAILSEQNYSTDILDERMVKLFLFSLKDMVKYLLCFENSEQSKYYKAVSSSLNRDISSFGKNQVYEITDYKITIDWLSRVISKLLYVSNLLAFASIGPKKVAKYDIKTARGISGPWAHLDLPMLERVFPFGDEIQQRERGKQKQRRYRKGLENYNNDGRVGEGHYWRELRNEPFSWFDRGTEDPYPSRSMLSGRG
jgi:hypothetical protein